MQIVLGIILVLIIASLPKWVFWLFGALLVVGVILWIKEEAEKGSKGKNKGFFAEMRAEARKERAERTVGGPPPEDGHDFEHHVAALLKKCGYKAKVTQGSGDFGVDIIASRGRETIAIQTKRYMGAVGVTAVQEVVTGKLHWKCDHAWVVTTGTFTKAAHDLAKSTGCHLIEYDDLVLNRNIPSAA